SLLPEGLTGCRGGTLACQVDLASARNSSACLIFLAMAALITRPTTHNHHDGPVDVTAPLERDSPLSSGLPGPFISSIVYPETVERGSAWATPRGNLCRTDGGASSRTP